MTKKHVQPVNHRFDETKSFAENCEAFLEAVSAEDPEIAAILCTNWDTLVTVVRDGERDPKVRGEFNKAVTLALDSLVKSIEPKGGA